MLEKQQEFQSYKKPRKDSKVEKALSDLSRKVLNQYHPTDIYALIKQKIDSGSYIEVFSLCDQYIVDKICRLLVVTENEINKLRENISPNSVLDIMFRLGIIEDQRYVKKVRDFRKLRHWLIHKSLRGEKIELTKEFLKLPYKIIQSTDNFYFINAMGLIRFDRRFLNKNKPIKSWFTTNEARLKFFLDFLLEKNFAYYSNSNVNIQKYKRKMVKEMADYLARVFKYVFPPIKNVGVKEDSKKFANHTIKILKRIA